MARRSQAFRQQLAERSIKKLEDATRNAITEPAKLERLERIARQRVFEAASGGYVVLPALVFSQVMFFLQARLVWEVASAARESYLDHVNRTQIRPAFRFSIGPFDRNLGTFNSETFEHREVAEDLAAALNLGRAARQKETACKA